MSDALEKSCRSQRKAKGSGHLRRAEIIEAAGQIFVQCGYEGATIRKIADAVGVSSTALYMHFRDKTEILSEICENTFAQLVAQNTELSALRLEPAARVRLMLEAYMTFALAHPNAYQLVFCSPRSATDSRPNAILAELGQRCYDLFLDAVRQVKAAGRLRSQDAAAAAQSSWAATHGLAALLITQPDFDWAPRDRLMATLLDGLFSGLVIEEHVVEAARGQGA